MCQILCVWVEYGRQHSYASCAVSFLPEAQCTEWFGYAQLSVVQRIHNIHARRKHLCASAAVQFSMNVRESAEQPQRWIRHASCSLETQRCTVALQGLCKPQQRLARP